jgi:CHASE3 domain sensor protein
MNNYKPISNEEFAKPFEEQIQKLESIKNELDKTNENYLKNLDNLELNIGWCKLIMADRIAERELMYSQIKKYNNE